MLLNSLVPDLQRTTHLAHCTASGMLPHQGHEYNADNSIHIYPALFISMAMDPQNSGFFNRAQHFTLANSQLTDIMISGSNNDIHVEIQQNNFPAMPNKAVLPPLPPLKHSSTLFTGRDDYLQRLRDYFHSSIGGERKSFLLYGLGGIGKTQICLKFIEQNSDL